MKRTLFYISIIGCILFFSQPVQAQFSIGASYEIRDEDPTNGFGLRAETGLFPDLPLLDLGLRAHFSYFNDTSEITLDDASISTDIKAYDYGLAALAGLKLGIVKPYVGLGIGSERFEANEFFEENNFYWNGFGGAQITVLPFLHPFIEYRIKNLSGREDVVYDNVSRLAIGLNLSF